MRPLLVQLSICRFNNSQSARGRRQPIEAVALVGFAAYRRRNNGGGPPIGYTIPNPGGKSFMASKPALVVDDSKTARFALRRFLETKGYADYTAENAYE